MSVEVVPDLRIAVKGPGAMLARNNERSPALPSLLHWNAHRASDATAARVVVALLYTSQSMGSFEPLNAFLNDHSQAWPLPLAGQLSSAGVPYPRNPSRWKYNVSASVWCILACRHAWRLKNSPASTFLSIMSTAAPSFRDKVLLSVSMTAYPPIPVTSSCYMVWKKIVSP